LIISLISLFLLSSCGGDKKAWQENLSAAEQKEFQSGVIPDERIENLKKGISFYEAEVSRTVKNSKQIGIYYRMLTLEYMTLEMYNEALKSVQKSLEYFPTSPLLYYYGAVSSAQMSMAVFDDDKQRAFIDLAERYYLRAISLDPKYNEALYGLSVLYIFELDRPFDAEPLLERLIARSRNNYDAVFLLARVKILKGEIDEAVDLYSKIEEKAPDDESRQNAKENRIRLLGGYGNG
jgi:tetratricopeptide (TPR) repeat protein